jgi:hypothetical protein
MLLALAASLVNAGGACKASHIATEYANAFDLDRGYGGSAQQASVVANAAAAANTTVSLPAMNAVCLQCCFWSSHQLPH